MTPARTCRPLVFLLSAGLIAAIGCNNDDQTEDDGGELERRAAMLGEAFTALDIGPVGPSGTYRELPAGTHTVEGAGADIWNGADAFRFVYQTLPGDGTITARVASLENTHASAKAGVMMRESVAAGSKNVMALLTPATANGYRFQARTTTGGTTSRPTSGTGAAPRWLRLTRSGNSFTAFSSANGTSWTSLGPAVSISMQTTILVGLAVTSHNTASLATAVFDNLGITTPTPPAPPSAPQGLVASAGNGQVSLTWAAVSGASSYTVKRRTGGAGAHLTRQSGLAATSFVDTGLSNGTSYGYVVSAVNAGGESADSGEAQATPVAPPPAVWSSQDIGSVGAAGSWTDVSGKLTLRGSGADIFGAADAFRFVHQSITGDVTVIARVESLTTTNTWTKAVVMIREDLTAGARNVAAVVSPTATNKYRLQSRSAPGGTTASVSSGANSLLPSWLKLERSGSSFRAYHSGNGTSWTQIGGTVTVAMAATVRVGLGVTSHVTSTLATGVFTNVSVAGPTPPPPVDAGVPPADGGPSDAGAPDAGTPDAGLPDGSPSAPDILVDAPELIFSAFRATRSVTRLLVVRNIGAASLQIAAPSIVGPTPAVFVFDGTAPGPINLAPGAQTTLRLVFTPSSTATLGTHSAALRLTSNDPDSPTLNVGLWGLATRASEGTNEPPLKQVVDTLGYPIDVGGTALALGTGPDPIGDEVRAPRFRKAGPGPVTMKPVARYSPDEPLPYGLYTTLTARTHLGTIAQGQFQTLLPLTQAGAIFATDPGEGSFGVYTTSATHSTFTEDGLNTGTVKHAVRSYPLKDRAGVSLPNTYLVGFEEAANGDYQDYVFVLGNVVPVIP
jgi:hypothetical protein